MSLTVSVILLSKDGNYVGEKGELPKRPSFDKEMITKLVTNRNVLCSENTLKTMPKTILNALMYISTEHYMPWDINFGVDTFHQLADIFIVTKSLKDMPGKHFRRDILTNNYINIYNTEEFELWIRN